MFCAIQSKSLVCISTRHKQTILILMVEFVFLSESALSPVQKGASLYDLGDRGVSLPSTHPFRRPACGREAASPAPVGTAQWGERG